jgi:hypothetical protein
MITPVLTSNENDSMHWRIFCQLAGKRDVIFYYEGYFSQAIIATVSDAVRMRTEHIGAAGMTRRKLFSSFIEMTQNIVHYSVDAYIRNDAEDFGNEVRHGSICISTNDGRFHLHCANPVRRDIALQLRNKLEYLRTLTNEDIKREYKRTLRADTAEASKGAGLGLLTMARDASEPLEFKFTPLRNSNNVLFFLKATI